MEKKQVLIGSAIISVVLTAILEIVFATALRGELGDNAKYVYIGILACLPVFFVLFIFVIKASNKQNAKNVEAAKKIKELLGGIEKSQNADEVVSLQTRLAQDLIHSSAAVKKLVSNEVLPALRKQVPGLDGEHTDAPAVRTRNEWMAKWMARSLAAMLASNSGGQRSIAEYGRAAYAFGGYPFMRQVMLLIGDGLDQSARDLLAGTADKLWEEVEDWPHNRIV